MNNSAINNNPLRHSLHAGVGKCEITNREPGVVVADPLYARALVLDDGQTKAVIIAMDVTAIGGRAVSDGMLPDVGEEFLPCLREKIAAELGIPGCNVLVNASHTHPPGRMLCNDQEQVRRTFAAVQQAAGSMQPVKVGSIVGKEERVAMNRTLRLKNGRDWTIRHSIPSPPPDQICGSGPLDNSVGIIRFDRLDGTPLALIFNFACHPLFGNYDGSLTANFPGEAARIIELELDTTALFLQGAAGDVCDVTFKDFQQERNAAVLGRYLAESVLAAQSNITTRPAGLKVVSEEIFLPRRTDIPARLAQLKDKQEALLQSLRFCSLNFELFLPLYLQQKECQDAGTESSPMYAFNQRNIEKYLSNLRAMETLSKIQDDIATLEKHAAINARAGGAPIPAEVMGVRIGDCVLVTAPFEALSEIGLDIKRNSPFPHTFLSAYTNGYLHYGAPAEYYDRGGYEVTECLLAPEWQQVYQKAVRKILAKMQ
ncbi:MAG: hypothetical protein GX927_05040 [Lentisphaerae bacterium]|jgi:hypothetical protein|nr:hypothetical protein [Lentisphaerota bacterium]